MDLTLILLLLALALTYAAWRAARRQAQAARAAREVELERGSCTLEPAESGDGRGFIVVLSSGERSGVTDISRELHADTIRSDATVLNWERHGVEVVPVAEFRAAGEAGTTGAFAAGSDVELIPDNDGSAIEVWDRGMTLRAGRVPDNMVREIDRRAEADEIGACVVVWERLAGGRRTGIDLLLVRADMMLES
ncbi:hypothetical protein BH23GEM9_BH23GEM9_15820 [soil metagenome]